MLLSNKSQSPWVSSAQTIAASVRRLLFNRHHDRVAKFDRPEGFDRWDLLRVFRDRCEELGWSTRQMRVYLGHYLNDPGTPDWQEPEKGTRREQPVLLVRVPLASLVALVMKVGEKR